MNADNTRSLTLLPQDMPLALLINCVLDLLRLGRIPDPHWLKAMQVWGVEAINITSPVPPPYTANKPLQTHLTSTAPHIPISSL